MAEQDDVTKIAQRIYQHVSEHGGDASAWAGAIAREIVRMRKQAIAQANENARVIAAFPDNRRLS